MEIKEKNQKIYSIELNEEEIDTLICDLENARKDWGTHTLTEEILKKLQELRK